MRLASRCLKISMGLVPSCHFNRAGGLITTLIKDARWGENGVQLSQLRAHFGSRVGCWTCTGATFLLEHHIVLWRRRLLPEDHQAAHVFKIRLHCQRHPVNTFKDYSTQVCRATIEFNPHKRLGEGNCMFSGKRVYPSSVVKKYWVGILHEFTQSPVHPLVSR
jgi:hypothetical protein